MFSLICTRINGWVNNGKAGDLRRYHANYDVTVMCFFLPMYLNILRMTWGILQSWHRTRMFFWSSSVNAHSANSPTMSWKEKYPKMRFDVQILLYSTANFPRQTRGRHPIAKRTIYGVFRELNVLCHFGIIRNSILVFTNRADSRFAPSQWETSLQSNTVSHWLGADLESAMYQVIASPQCLPRRLVSRTRESRRPRPTPAHNKRSRCRCGVYWCS